MHISFCNHKDKQYQKRLNNLLKPIFLDFQFWYDLNLWDDRYESYSILREDEIISNVCLYKARVLFDGQRYDALSVGAVATKPAYRGQGYAKAILEHILQKYSDVPLYLSANNTVAGFYPRFGFRRVYEKLPVASYAIRNAIPPRKLRFDDAKVWKFAHDRTNLSKRLDCLNAASIHLFHIYEGSLADCIYDIPELDTIVIARQTQTVLKIIGVFSLREIFFRELAQYLPFTNVSTLAFGFMPYWDDLPFTMRPYETDPLFVRNVNCTLSDFKFPELSVT